MRAFLTLCLFLPLAGCLAGTSSGRSSTTYVHDNGVYPVQRTTVSQSYSGSTFGASVPIMMNGGYGYGGNGPMTVNSGSCVLHPDNCAVIQTAPYGQPMTVVSTGGAGGSTTVGSGGAGTYGPADTSDLEARIERVEGSIQKLKGATKLTLKRSCQIITGNPEVIKDAEERRKIVGACTQVLNANPTTEEK